MQRDRIAEMIAAVAVPPGYLVRNEYVAGSGSDEVRIRVSKDGVGSLVRVTMETIVKQKDMAAVEELIADSVADAVAQVEAAAVVEMVAGLGQTSGSAAALPGDDLPNPGGFREWKKRRKKTHTVEVVARPFNEPTVRRQIVRPKVKT